MTGRSSVDDRRLRPARLETNVQRPSTAPHSGTPSGTRHPTPSQLETTPEHQDAEQAPRVSTKPGHQAFVLTDPVAFRYLEEDPQTIVLERRGELQGYECYIVEQWATSRTHPTSVITTYTGDTSHAVVVSVLSVPTDESTWSPRLRVYFKALNQYHAKRRETTLGVMMVTNLSVFPSTLTVIPVPDGDLKKHRFDFVVNENLKRLGCSGRVGLTLTPPSSATVAKFHQLYRTSDKNDVNKSVIELVKLCQSALMLFEKLEIDYADGLLCDVTERAINDWWIEIGSEQYNIEPHDGILGPTTVAGLLGLLMGARNRLHACGCPVAKDAFDVDATKRGISYFQKQQRVTRNRRLDRRTLDRLHKATQKAAEHGGWSMPKVLKNTAAELSGKGGEMVMDAVGRRDRAGIAEIETCDIERFVQLVYGGTCKWLWLGKAIKKAREQPHHERMGKGEGPGMSRNLVFKPDEHGGFAWKARRGTVVDGQPAAPRKSLDTDSPAYEEGAGTEDESRFGMFKRASGFKHEAKSGLGKFKGAVGLKGHHSKPSVDDSPTSPVEEGMKSRRPMFRRAQSSPLSSPNSPNSINQEHKLDAAVVQQRQRISTDSERANQASKQRNYNTPFSNADASKESLDRLEEDAGSDSDRATTVTIDQSIAGSIYEGVDLNDVLPTGPDTEKDVAPVLRRTLSLSHFVSVQLEHRSDDAYPRHLSFSLAEDSVLTWEDIAEDDGEDFDDSKAQLAEQELLARQTKHIRLAISELGTITADWTQEQLRTLALLLQQADRDEDYLENSLHNPHLEHVNYLQTHSEGVLREQKERLEEGGKEVETLAAKLEYEINGLRGRVEDVEAGVSDFSEGVGRVEDRVKELEKDGEKRTGWGCVMS